MALDFAQFLSEIQTSDFNTEYRNFRKYVNQFQTSASVQMIIRTDSFCTVLCRVCSAREIFELAGKRDIGLIGSFEDQAIAEIQSEDARFLTAERRKE